MPDVVSYERDGDIAIITVDNPPVNALSLPVRRGLANAFAEFEQDGDAKAAVLICAGRTFIAGADITEFDKPIEDPWLPLVVEQIEACTKVVVAAIHGTALGGGFETAMACHYRCAVASAKVGLPEVLLGLLAGATGTQRLPRLIGVRDALDVMVSGKPMAVPLAFERGAVDEMIDGDLRDGAIAYAKRLISENANPRRISEIVIDPASIPDGFFADYRKDMAHQTRGYFAPEQIVKSVEAAVSLPYAESIKRENELFMTCMASTHSQAQRHLFFADREISKIPDVPKDTPTRPLEKVAIVGGGTMGGGIAMNFVNVGIPVLLKEVNQEALDRGLNIIRGNYAVAAKKGRLSEDQLEKNMSMIHGTLNYADLGEVDIVIEAVFENMALKKEIFAILDETCKVGAILASNTSTLDIDEIATATQRPQDVIGLHFFAPANIMTLLEIVRGAKTSKNVIATSMQMAKTIRKSAVLVGCCFGFVANRMFFPYIREAQLMILEGVAPERIDQVAFDWGMAMGPNSVSDLSGLDVLEKVRTEWIERPDDPVFFRMITKLVEQGRMGQKSGAGIYNYDGRKAVPDREVTALARSEAAALGVKQIEVSDEEIIERLFYSMINEGALILEEGIALRPSDIDVVYASGYGMGRYRGGPMWYADTVGLKTVCSAMQKYRKRYGDLYWSPAPLLEKLANSGKTFDQWSTDRS